MNNEPPPETQTTPSTRRTLTLEPNDARHLAILCGHLDGHLRQIEQRLGIRLSARGNQFVLEGPAASVVMAERLLVHLYADICQGVGLSPESLHLQLQQSGLENLADAPLEAPVEALQIIRTKRASIKARGRNQQSYVRSIKQQDINFGIGPAGTGKTYLAVACAVEALLEVAPLAFMRGRTLNNSFIILDEAQNTTREQMKMFLTRIGFGSTAVITGDATQIDLPRGTQSGLTHVSNILDGVDGISFTYFGNKDVVRHPLVQRIVEAYDRAEDKATPLDKSKL